MNIRKIAVIGGFAAGAALALAPLASAATDPLADILNAEIASMNSTFNFDALLAGVSDKVIPPSDTNPFATIPLEWAPNQAYINAHPTETVNLTLDRLLYGSDPIANASGDPGAYNVMNGATAEFDNMFNVEWYSLLHGGLLTGFSPDDVFGSESVINAALAVQDGVVTATAAEAAQAFFNAGWDDMLGYYSLPWP